MGVLKKKVIMFQLPYQEFRSIKTWGNIPFGAGMLKAMAQQEGFTDLFDIEILPGLLVDHAGDAWLIDYLEAKRPDIICATLYLWNSRRSIYVAEQLKTRLPGLLFIVGGPEVCEDSPYIIENQAVDYGCMGEGEELFIAVLRAIAEDRDPALIPGLFWRREGRFVLTPGRGIVKDLDRLPSPMRMGILQLRNAPIVSYETMRGCARSCMYCITGTVPWRSFSADRVVEDFAYLHENGVKTVRVVCSNFLLHPDFLAICGRLARINADRSMSLACFSYPEDVTSEKASALKACNFESVELGLQTIHTKTLKTLRRHPFSESRFLEGLGHLRDAGIDFSIDLIAGLPGETVEDMEGSIAFVKNNQVRYYNIFPLELLPGSPLRKKAREMGIDADPLPPYRVTRTPSLTQEQINSCVKEEKIARQDFFFELAQEFRLPRFCSFRCAADPLREPQRTIAPVDKLLVSSAVDAKWFAESASGRFGANVVMFFSNLRQSLGSFTDIFESVCRANPFCQIMPVFAIGTAAELDAVLKQCQAISKPNLVQKTLIMNSLFSMEQGSLPKGFTPYEEIRIQSRTDMERVSACGIRNILIDLSPELDPVVIASVLESLAASGKNIQFKNFVFYYLDHLLRERNLGKPGRIHAPVDMGNIVRLDGKGRLTSDLVLSSRKAMEIAHMQLLFMRFIRRSGEEKTGGHIVMK